METRVEKYKAYREEIKAKLYIISQINSKNNKITTYKKQIDDISENILSNLSIYEHITPFYSINQNQHSEITAINNILSGLDNKLLDSIQKKIYEINESNTVANKFAAYDYNGKFNEKWLDKYDDYKNISIVNDHFANITWTFKEFDEPSLKEYENKNNDIDKIKVYTTEVTNKKTRNTYYVSVIAVLSILAILIATVIFKIESQVF